MKMCQCDRGFKSEYITFNEYIKCMILIRMLYSNAWLGYIYLQVNNSYVQVTNWYVQVTFICKLPTHLYKLVTHIYKLKIYTHKYLQVANT